jgi:predicted dehydrogenase
MVINNFKVKRIAIIGFGSIGKRHLKVLKKLRPEIKIILIRTGLGKKLSEEKSAEFIFRDIKDINLKIDAAIISSPAPYHLSQAKKFIEKKIPVLIEKPLSHNFEGINSFKFLCKKLDAIVLVGYVLRYSKSLNFFRKMVSKINIGNHSSVIIKCYSYLPDWRPKSDYSKSLSARKELGGGVLLELSHELDYSDWIFGPFKKIDAKLINSGTLNINVEDEAELSLISKNNLPVFISLSFNSKKNERTCKLIGSKGSLIWDGIRNCVKYQNVNGKIKKWKFNNKKDKLFEEQITHFLECIEKKKTPIVSLTNSIDVLKLVLNAKKSNKKNKIINIV